MKLTTILMEEHRVIEQMLGVLHAIAHQGLKAGRLNGEDAAAAIDFLQTFADQCHHGKEEDLLFPAFEATGIPQHAGPTGCMLHEHTAGREHIQQMAASLSRASEGNAAALRQFAEHALGYEELLRNHIFKEDNILFPLADQRLTPEAQAGLLRGAEHVEHDHMGAGTHERYLAIGNALADKYGIARAQVASHTGCGCGCKH